MGERLAPLSATHAVALVRSLTSTEKLLFSLTLKAIKRIKAQLMNTFKERDMRFNLTIRNSSHVNYHI
jgi:hypothetical protein